VLPPLVLRNAGQWVIHVQYQTQCQFTECHQVDSKQNRHVHGNILYSQGHGKSIGDWRSIRLLNNHTGYFGGIVRGLHFQCKCQCFPFEAILEGVFPNGVQQVVEMGALAAEGGECFVTMRVVD
jgi:hypothetical protein